MNEVDSKNALLRLSLGGSWLFLILFGIFTTAKPEWGASAFSLVIPILLLIFLAHEWQKPRKGLVWGTLALVVCIFILFALWRQLQARGLVQIFLHLTLGVVILQIANALFRNMDNAIGEVQEKISDVQNVLKSKTQENDFYGGRIEKLKDQIGQRQRLAAYAREMGTLLDPEVIKQALIDKTQKLFPQEAVSLKTSSFSEDAIDAWVMEKRTSLLVQDLPRDSRFAQESGDKPSAQSVIVTPLVVERNLMGLLRVDSKTRQRFSGAELQQIEIYAHLAALALENAQLFLKVNAMATLDGLTGLATHRIFQEKLAEELLRAARYHTPVALLMIDIDHFKGVNDTHGHLAGDDVLKEAAQILMRNCSSVDFAARYGGEEFAIILPGLGVAEARGRAETLRAEIEAHRVLTAQKSLAFTVSIGCASFPEDAPTASQLIRRADERLYQAKSQGRNRVMSQ